MVIIYLLGLMKGQYLPTRKKSLLRTHKMLNQVSKKDFFSKPSIFYRKSVRPGKYILRLILYEEKNWNGWMPGLFCCLIQPRRITPVAQLYRLIIDKIKSIVEMINPAKPKLFAWRKKIVSISSWNSSSLFTIGCVSSQRFILLSTFSIVFGENKRKNPNIIPAIIEIFPSRIMESTMISLIMFANVKFSLKKRKMRAKTEPAIKQPPKKILWR